MNPPREIYIVIKIELVTMSNYRKKLSGSANKKRAHDKLRHATELFAKTPKLETFFAKDSNSQLLKENIDDLHINSESAFTDHQLQKQEGYGSSAIHCNGKTIMLLLMVIVDSYQWKSDQRYGYSVHKSFHVHVSVNVDDSDVPDDPYAFQIPRNKEDEEGEEPASESYSRVQSEQRDNVTVISNHPNLNSSPEILKINSTGLEEPVNAIISDDPAKWVINNNTRDILLKREIKQNSNKDFSSSKRVYSDRTRYVTKSLFERTLANGQTQPRSWLVYSESRASIFCAPCKIFEKTSNLATIGYADWKNVHHRLKHHENSLDHRSATATLLERTGTDRSIDTSLVSQLKREIQYWQNVVRRVVAVIKSLAISVLAFRGSNERFHSDSRGNYIAALELIAEFDPFLAEHIRLHGNQGRGSTSYLSSTICDELIILMETHVTAKIISDTKKAKYFTISVDSTPDISHIDQLTFILRYVNKEGCPEERFIKFIPNTGHKGEEIITHVLSTLEDYGLDILNCRGQSYDNASNMSGLYSGLQARVKVVNPLVEYVPCAAHTLNLVGKCAVESCPGAIHFFAVLKHLYTFFSASTHRWEILVNHLNMKGTGPVVKNLSRTGWSAHADACKSLCASWDEILDALSEISDRVDEKAETRAEASGLLNSLNTLEICFIALVWNEILCQFHSVSKALQSVDIKLPTVVELYKSLIEYVEYLREKFDIYECKAIEKCDIHEYVQNTMRPRRRTTRFNENQENAHRFCGRENYVTKVRNVGNNEFPCVSLPAINCQTSLFHLR